MRLQSIRCMFANTLVNRGRQPPVVPAFCFLLLPWPAYEEWKARGQMRTKDDLRDAIYHGAVKRVRPKVMTVSVAFFGLLPIMFGTGTGADVMKRIAAPMVGGLFTSFLMGTARVSGRVPPLALVRRGAPCDDYVEKRR